MAATSQRIRPSRRSKRNLSLIGLRVNEGLTRRMLAYRAGVSRETVRQVEEGWVPNAEIQFDIAKVFGLRPLDIWPIDQQREVVR